MKPWRLRYKVHPELVMFAVVLLALAIPFLQMQSKSLEPDRTASRTAPLDVDASVPQLLELQRMMEACGRANDNSYVGCATHRELKEHGKIAADQWGGAKGQVMVSQTTESSYVLTARSAELNGTHFTLKRTKDGAISRTCKPIVAGVCRGVF